MMLAAAVALMTATASPVAQAPASPPLAEAARAIEAGRLTQARLMIGNAVAAGETGPDLARLLANLAFAENNNAAALAAYEQLIASGGTGAPIFERAGLAALKLGLTDKALDLIARAIGEPGATWRAWNARGVIADLQSDWPTADAAYERAASIKPAAAEVANNRGWSQLLRGNWAAALVHFQEAAAADPKSKRIVNNLELTRAALASDLPRRRPGETDLDWANRLNDAGVAAQLLGDSRRAAAAFTQALEASGSWYPRAAANLDELGHNR